MKKWIKRSSTLLLLAVAVLGFGATAYAKGEERIKNGVYADNVDLSGMTGSEAQSAVELYVEQLKNTEITLIAAGDKEIVVTAGDFGLTWSNPGLVEEALLLGKSGNIITRYKAMKDLEQENKVYKVELSLDVQAIDSILLDSCVRYDQKPIDTALKRENDAFTIVEGQIGYQLDVESSIDLIEEYLLTKWDYNPVRIPLVIEVAQPRGSVEDLQKVTDVLGHFTTSYVTSGTSRSANVQNGCRLIDGITLYPGDEFSTYEAVSPFSEANGYYMAGSYLNGKVVDSLGGGICQVSSTLYNAVLLAELDVTERHNHSMIVSYVSPSSDAAIAESAGKDFRFVNNTDAPIYIEGYTKNKQITFNIYGQETRDPGHKVSFESEVIETIEPPADMIYADASQPIGYIIVESAHIGYKAQLWKIVTENGVQVSREKVNSSNYKMAPRSATVGTATGDPNAANEIAAAIGTANIDHVRNVIALLTAPKPEEE